jgi:hypothetical protein
MNRMDWQWMMCSTWNSSRELFREQLEWAHQILEDPVAYSLVEVEEAAAVLNLHDLARAELAERRRYMI